MMRCVNCGLTVDCMRRHSMSSLSTSLQNILAQWLSEIQLFDNAVICHECFRLLQVHRQTNTQSRQFGHKMVCLGCGYTLLPTGRRRHTLVFNSPLWNIISSWNPEHLAASWRNNMLSCHTCWVRAKRHLLIQDNINESLDDSMANPVMQVQDRNIATEPNVDLIPVLVMENVQDEPPVDLMLAPVMQHVQDPNIPEPPVMPADLIVPQPVIRAVETVILPSYKRVANTSRRCIFRGCEERSWHLMIIE